MLQTQVIACNISAKQLLNVLCQALSNQPGFAVVRAPLDSTAQSQDSAACSLVYFETRAKLVARANKIDFEQFSSATTPLRIKHDRAAWASALDAFIDRFGLAHRDVSHPAPILAAITYEAGTTLEQIAPLPPETELACAFAYSSVLILPDDTSKPIQRVCFEHMRSSQTQFTQWINALTDQPQTAARSSSARKFIEELPLSDYTQRVETIKAAIVEGKVYQVNLTQRIRLSSDMTCGQRIYALFSHNPARHALALRLDDSRLILSASPELFLSRSEDRVISEPIKGTCKRHSDPQTDTELRNELLQSEKDHAELAMIVDLIRNDLSRVARSGSVKVEAHRELMTLPYVYHLFSRVCANVPSASKLSQLLAATFPCGSITGAPKIAAMQMIHALERSARGYYCGALGYIKNHRFFSLNVAIRSGLLDREEFTFGVGGGVVFDSQAVSEHAECMAKAQVFLAN